MGVMKELATRRMMGESIALYAWACGLTEREIKADDQQRLFTEEEEHASDPREDQPEGPAEEH